MKALADAPVRRRSGKAPISAMQHPHSKADGRKQRTHLPRQRAGLVKRAWSGHAFWDMDPRCTTPTATAWSRRSEMRSAHPHTL